MSNTQSPISPKSYGVAVSLAAIFGVMGIHHFYTGRVLLGLCDLGLFIATFSFYILASLTSEGSYIIAALLCFIIDLLHTIFVTVRLLIGEERDGQGRIIAYPGQFSKV